MEWPRLKTKISIARSWRAEASAPGALIFCPSQSDTPPPPNATPLASLMRDSSVEKAVKEDVAFLKNEVLVDARDHISGWIYDVDTGKVKRIV